MNCLDYFVRELITETIVVFKPDVYQSLISSARFFFGNTTGQQTEASSAFDSSDIPIIKNYNVLVDGYKSSEDEKDVLNFSQEMFSAFEGFSERENNNGWKYDVNEVSLYFHKLLDSVNREEIIPIPSTHKENNALEAHRNVRAHSNYFYKNGTYIKHATWYRTILEKLAFDKIKQKRVKNLRNDEWLIWNWNKHSKKNKLVFCYIIKDDDFQALFHKFKNGCKEMIDKSYLYYYIKKKLYARYQLQTYI